MYNNVQPGARPSAPLPSPFWRTQWISIVPGLPVPPVPTHPVKKEAPGQHRGVAKAEGWRESQQAAAELQEASVGELGEL